MFIGTLDAKAEAPVLWPPDVKSRLIRKDPDAGKDWKQEEKGMTGWDVWMASLTQWTWVWVSSGRWWRTGKPGVLQYVGSQRVRHDWVTEQQSKRVYIGRLQCAFLWPKKKKKRKQSECPPKVEWIEKLFSITKFCAIIKKNEVQQLQLTCRFCWMRIIVIMLVISTHI